MYDNWSPLQLCHALGLRIDLRSKGGGRVPYIQIGHKSHNIHRYEYAVKLLKRMARRKKVKGKPPLEYKRALVDGKEQASSRCVPKKICV